MVSATFSTVSNFMPEQLSPNRVWVRSWSGRGIVKTSGAFGVLGNNALTSVERRRMNVILPREILMLHLSMYA